MPVAYDRITVDTWVEGVMRFFTSRNFAIRGNDGRQYGYGRSIWAMIDTDSRQPVDILAERDGLISEYIETGRPCPIEPFQRVRVGKDAKCWRVVDTYYSDVDVNGHINSVKYIEHILDLWPIDFYRHNRLKRFDIAYVAESHCGDRLHMFVDEQSEGEYCVQVMRQTPGDSDAELKEVCRCKVKFVKE